MNAQTPGADRHQRCLLFWIALLFFAPLALSFYLYYGLGARGPAKHVNHGDLIEPPRAVPQLALTRLDAGMTGADLLTRKWTLLYVNAGACGEACRRKLYETRQVRLALNRDMVRVQRVLIADPDCCAPEFLRDEHADLIAVRSAGAAALIAALPAQGGVPPANAGRVYVVDPLGNLMMSYAKDAPPKGLLEDMKRLLKFSHIG